MTPELEALGRRAIAFGWKWSSGCVDQDGWIVTCVVGKESRWSLTRKLCTGFHSEERTAHEDAPFFSEIIPDFSDDATKGCLLALVRESWGAAAHTVRLGLGEWVVYRGGFGGGGVIASADTEAGALVAALEAASKLKKRKSK